jgi:hypothetical protein
MLQHRVPQYVELRERNVDLVFGPIVRRLADDDLETEILFREDLLVVTGSQNACNRRRRHALADLIDQPWCLPPLDSLVGMRCVEAFRASGLDLPRRMVTSVSMQLQNGAGHDSRLSHDVSRLARAVRRPPFFNQGFADRSSGRAAPHRDHHLEEPHNQPGGAALRSSGPGGRKADSQTEEAGVRP